MDLYFIPEPSCIGNNLSSSSSKFQFITVSYYIFVILVITSKFPKICQLNRLSSLLKSALVTWGKCNQGFLSNVGVRKLFFASDIEILWGLFSKKVSKKFKDIKKMKTKLIDAPIINHNDDELE